MSWDELIPSFDAWWPNIFASVVWAPIAAGFLGFLHWLTRRHQKKIVKKQARIEQLLVNLHEHHGILVPKAEE